ACRFRSTLRAFRHLPRDRTGAAPSEPLVNNGHKPIGRPLLCANCPATPCGSDQVAASLVVAFTTAGRLTNNLLPREGDMRIKAGFYLATATIPLVLGLAGPATQLCAQTPMSVAIDSNSIGGVVTSPNGPEAGVWVIAETRNLPTRFARIVVTDDQGRYVL